MVTSAPELLDAAVSQLGGARRDGQHRMVDAVTEALASNRHLLVQAGTGTGKSLGYLVPAAIRSMDAGSPVVVATATLALQAQLVERDLPLLTGAAEHQLGRPLRWAVLKGRVNYACLQRVRAGAPDDDGVLVPAAQVPTSELGREVLRVRRWAEEEAEAGRTGDRDALQPGVSERAWRQVSVTARECLGARDCPFAAECFAERARATAGRADIVVTNHAMLALHWIDGVPLLPEHEVVVVDEGHELASRVTGVATAEVSGSAVGRAVRRARRHLESDDAEDAETAGKHLDAVLAELAPGRLDALPAQLVAAVAEVRDAARAGLSGLRSGDKGDPDPGRRVAQASLEEVFTVADRIVAARTGDVVWVAAGREKAGPSLHVAPLSVAGLLRAKLLDQATVVVTSATLALGGSFEPVARSLGLGVAEENVGWEGLDVGSPFDYASQGIVYCAAALPAPGRDGLAEATLEEIAALVDAADGGTLGLFSSRRAAEQATEYLREHRPDHDVYCQGEDVTGSLVRRFREQPDSCLFGTLSLWQGVDIPGESCRLVLIDRIPFPRPDDPLMSARQRAVDQAGGSGFMQVAVAHAALLLAQGAGRLIRSGEDRGVVAVLDSRIVRARYGGFLRASLPPMWPTQDRDVVLGALRRLRVSEGEGQVPLAVET